MPVIYEPKGRAREYSPLALNLYNGCSHGCKYCYAPGIMHKKREDYVYAKPRKGIVNLVKADMLKFAGDPRPILLCFSCDPYQPAEEEHGITRQVLEVLGEHDCKIRILTKGAMLALRDFDLMKKYDVEFGVTLVFDNENDRQIWEPGADTTEQRLAALKDAYALGICTWVSMEPVFYPSQTLELIRSTQSFVTNYKVGKLNHMPHIERNIDWKRFVEDVVLALMTTGRHYYIKNDLWAYALERFRRAYHQTE